MSWFSDLWSDGTGATNSKAQKLARDMQRVQTIHDENLRRQAQLDQEGEARDNIVRAERDRIQAAETAAILEREAQDKTRRLTRDTVRSDAQRSGRNYFDTAGVNSDSYGSLIDAEVDRILGTIPETETTFGTAFNDVGRNVYEKAQQGEREGALSIVRSSFAPGFEQQRIGSTLDDSILAGIESEDRAKADQFIENMFKRGIINDSGAAAARTGLRDQGPRVRTMLDTVGGDILEGGRQNLLDVSNRAGLAAETLPLGAGFDISQYTSDADKAFGEFMKTLPDTIKSRLSGPLYDTSGFGAIAGAGQAPQNLRYDPAFMRTGQANEDDEESLNLTSPKRSIF